MPGLHVKFAFEIRKWSKVHTNDQIMIRFFRSGMNKLVYIFLPNEFVIGQVVLKSFIKRIAVAMVNKTVVIL
jgi:hypothetical protein